jgi:hypothetical protein
MRQTSDPAPSSSSSAPSSSSANRATNDAPPAFAPSR